MSGLATWVVDAVLIGVGATAVMDLWALLQRRLLGIPSLDFAMVGRWLGHLPRRVLAHLLFIRRYVHAIDFVCGDIALQPLHLWPEFAQHVTGLVRHGFEFCFRQLPGPWNLAFNHEFRHGNLALLLWGKAGSDPAHALSRRDRAASLPIVWQPRKTGGLPMSGGNL